MSSGGVSQRRQGRAGHSNRNTDYADWNKQLTFGFDHGLNSSWNVGSLPARGLAPGQSMNVEFLFGIVKDGNTSTSVVATVTP